MVITSVLLSIFLYRTDLKYIFQTIFAISLLVLICSFIFSFIAFFLNSFKWKLLLPYYSFFTLFRLNIIAVYYSTILPGQLAGDGVKAYILGKGQTDRENIVTSILIDKITGVIGLLLLGIVGLLFTKHELPNSVTNLVSIVIILGISSLLFLRFNSFLKILLNFLNFCKVNMQRAIKILSFIEDLLMSFHKYSKDSPLLIVNIILGVLYQMINILFINMLAKNIGIDINFIDWCWIFGVLSLVLFIPITLGGLGLREGTLVGLLGWLGISQEKALALSLSIFGIQVIFAFIGGILDFQMGATKLKNR